MKTWNVCDYGACYSDKLQTEAFQKAIDDCFLSGGGRVVVPCGVYVIGGIRLRSGVELYLETGAIVKGSRNPEDYYGYLNDTLEPVTLEPVGKTSKTGRSAVSTSRWSNGLIRAFDAHDIAVTGEKGSYFDGSNCYDPQGENDFRGPHGMSFWRCKGIRLEGYTFINSSNWCHAIFKSEDITMKNVSVYAGFDGLDVRTCDNVLVEDCKFFTGDDCIAGFDNNDVVVRNCLLNTACMPLRFGGNHVLVENCVSNERRFGSRVRLSSESKVLGNLTDETVRHESWAPFSYYCDHRADPRKYIGDIVFRNCRFEQERELIRIEFDGLHRWCCNLPLRQVRFENCEIKDLCGTGMIWSTEDEKVTVEYVGCRISGRAGTEKPIVVAGNFEKILFEDCVIDGFTDPTILVATDDPVEFVRTAPVTVKRTTQEECIAAHPTGLASQDIGKNLRFQ
ncbi:MAG: right-handed parallel beta-helix repeat-containing protein [Lachnospiraceae bacterium]|nr:right-handed parallel beta-helix repeat-containing protein [Lachnospiraceae bacterium]